MPILSPGVAVNEWTLESRITTPNVWVTGTAATTSPTNWYSVAGTSATTSITSNTTGWLVSPGNYDTIQFGGHTITVTTGNTTAATFVSHRDLEAGNDPFRGWVQIIDDAQDPWGGWARQADARIEVRATREELAVRAARRQDAWKAAEHERKIAELRAKRLLIDNITVAQRKSLKERGFFDVNVQGRTYRIKWGSHGNVYLVEGGREVRSFCIQPPDVPPGDAMLAQKLLLETDERSFLQIANARELRN